MKKVLVTGGTVFVSRYIAEYYVKKNYDVYVLNRNTRQQSKGVHLIKADRNNLKDVLKEHHFDVVFDITSYNANDINNLLDALKSFSSYIFISSSAVYPEYLPLPFKEDMPIGENKIWGFYGKEKVEAEKALLLRVPDAFIIRPPYLYGPMNNVYREAFVFDCAIKGRKFFLPQDGNLKLQFFYIDDLCLFMDALIEKQPVQRIYNVGNEETITVREWVKLCYKVANQKCEFENVYLDINQRNYFPFYNYEYYLDVSRQKELLPKTKKLEDGLKESLAWYLSSGDEVSKKAYIDFIDKKLSKRRKNI
ncbi:MAG: NAD-dependent epimerase/dehydratase family protein [Bacilli bacterium]|nr:NAD-dependent epimerase/dehydratase family protein [Bacilli bacterium]